MGKRAAERMNYRAGQLEYIHSRLKQIEFPLLPGEDAVIRNMAIAMEQRLEALWNVAQAIRGDAEEEYERGQEWYREHMAEQEERRQQARIQAPIRAVDILEGIEWAEDIVLENGDTLVLKKHYVDGKMTEHEWEVVSGEVSGGREPDGEARDDEVGPLL